MTVGRPPRFGTAATIDLHVRITLERKRELEAVARDMHTDVASVIRRAVDVFALDSSDRPVFARPRR
jgi:hypothetical protein